MIPSIQTSFISGELSPSVFGRTDKAQYRNGASTMRNFFVSYRGGAYSRAGFAFVGMCKQAAANAGGTATSNPPRIIDFQYNIEQGFSLEFGDQYMRVVYRGAYVIEAAQNISSISQGNPGVITIANHGFSNGDWLYAASIGGMTEFNGLTWIAQNVTTNTFTLTDLFGNSVNTTSFPTYTSGGTFARIYTATSPYAAADLQFLKFTQSANTMNLTCWNQNTLTEYPPYNLVRNSDINWEFTEVSFESVISPPTNVQSGATANLQALEYTTTYSYCVTAVDQFGNESIASIPTYNQNYDISIYAGTNGITWTGVGNAVQYNIYAATPIYNGNNSNTPTPQIGVPYGLLGTAFGLSFADTNITPDFTTSPPLNLNPFAPGTILNVTPTGGGSGLSQNTIQYKINTSTGSGFSGTPIISTDLFNPSGGGNFVGFIINSGGINYADTDTIELLTGGAYASGSYTFTGNPTTGQTIILNGVTWTFETNPTASAETKIGVSLAATLNQLASDLTTSGNSSLVDASYSISSGTVLDITYNNLGTIGNSYTLAAGTYGGVVSGTTLTGGADGAPSGATATLTVGPQTGIYPGTVQYYQDRLVYADTPNEPDTYFMSQSGLYGNFDASIPVIDSDAITGTPWGMQINGIQFMVPTINGLLTFTGNGVWLINGGNSAAITPSDQNAQAQAQIGCSAIVPPLYINLHILYVQSKNSIVRDIAYNFLYNVFQGTDITVFSNHLFFGYTITQWAYAEEPFKIVWAVRNDGTLLSLTYMKEQEIEGWARHDTNGQFISVCSVTEPPVDAVYVVTYRYIVGEGVWAYYLERLDDRQWTNAEDCFCVDAGLSYPVTYPNATLYPAAAEGTSSINSTNLIAGGIGYTNPTAYAVDSSNQGTNATFTVNMSGGVVTSVVPVNQGEDYTEGTTQIFIEDPTGTGAVASPIITNYVNFTASASVFTSGMVGNYLRVDGGKAEIIQFISGTEVVGNIVQPLTDTMPNDPNNLPVPAPSGEWSVSTPTTTVTGLNHLNGMTVSILADGGVQQQQVVENGSITLQTPASIITVGLPFTAQLQSMYLEMPSQATIQGRRKNIAAVTVRMEQTRGISVGTNQVDASTQPNNANIPWVNMIELKERNLLIDAGAEIPLYTGDMRVIVPGLWRKNGQVAIQTSYPLGVNILAVIPETSMGDPPG